MQVRVVGFMAMKGIQQMNQRSVLFRAAGIRAFFVCVALLGPFGAAAKSSVEKYVVVEAEELLNNPQRYWSRGVVFEDTLISVTRKRDSIGDRKYTRIETAALGTLYVDAKALEQARELPLDASYIFAGTMRSTTRRNWFFRSSTKYFVTAEAIVAPPSDVSTNLIAAFAMDAANRPAFQYLQQAIDQAQQLLLGYARDQEVEVSTLFNPVADRMDKPAEVARVAIRTVEQESGMTSSEILSLLVREMLAQEWGVAPAPMEEVEPAEPLEEDPSVVAPEAEPEPVIEFVPEPEPVPDVGDEIEAEPAEAMDSEPDISEEPTELKLPVMEEIPPVENMIDVPSSEPILPVPEMPTFDKPVSRGK